MEREATNRASWSRDDTVSRISRTRAAANAFLQDEEAAYAGGMNGYVTKPVDMEKLVKTIFQVCRKEAAGG